MAHTQAWCKSGDKLRIALNQDVSVSQAGYVTSRLQLSTVILSIFLIIASICNLFKYHQL